MFVLSLMKNFITIEVLENCGYDVIFNKGKTFLRHIATGQVKKIRVLVKNLCALEVEDACTSLRSKAKTRDMVVERKHVRTTINGEGSCRETINGETKRRKCGDIH